MVVTPPLTFSVTHVGRGGEITCRCEAGTLSLGIEMHTGGNCSTGLRGVRLRTPDDRMRRLDKEERQLVFDRLRAWLDETGRRNWLIEPVRANEFLSDEILLAVRAAFPPAKRNGVIARLSQYRGKEAERVFWGILILADGDLDEVTHLVEAARSDYRNVLYWAEYPEQAGSKTARAELIKRYELLRAAMEGRKPPTRGDT